MVKDPEQSGAKDLADDPMWKLLNSMSEQMMQLVHHVAEVRRANRRLDERLTAFQDKVEAELAEVKSELARTRADLTNLIHETAAHLSGKIDHFLKTSLGEVAETRALIEMERYERRIEFQKLVERVERIEQQLAR